MKQRIIADYSNDIETIFNVVVPGISAILSSIAKESNVSEILVIPFDQFVVLLYKDLLVPQRLKFLEQL